MTGCPPVETLARLLADALTADEAAGVEAHVERCPACQAELERRTGNPPVTPPLPAFAPDPDLLRVVTAAVGPTADLPAVPGYRVHRELGRGGMGVVYAATDERLGRPVALKLLTGVDAGGRFRREAAAIARVRHPDIVQIYEVGTAAGRPFLALELVDGPSLDRWAAGRPLPVRPAAELVEAVSRAVHAAHRAGVVHRDLKPANILMAASDERGTMNHESRPRAPGPPASGPDSSLIAHRSSFRPKVADFGLAKLLDEAAGDSATRSGQLLGTPSYAAPEQLVGRAGGEIGPAADVYALGAVLYELLTGRPPFRAATPLDTLLQSVHHDPVNPARLRPDVPRDLATVCLHALRKLPAARYASAADLADDLRRFLDGKPVRARPVGWAGRAARWTRRNPAAAGLIATVVLAAGGGLAGLGYLWREAERRAAVEARRSAEVEVDRALELCERGDVGRGVTALAETIGRLPADHPLGWTARVNLVAWQHHLVPLRRVLTHPANVTAVALAGDRLATVCDDGTAHLWELSEASGGRRPPDSPPGGEAAHSPEKPSGGLRPPLALGTGVTAVAFSPDGSKLLAAGKDGAARLWPTGEPIRHDGPVRAVGFAPDGRPLTGSADGTARLGDVVFDADSPVESVAASPDGKRVLTGSADGRVQVWDAATGRPAGDPVRVRGPVRFAAFAPDGSGWAAGGPGGLVGRVPAGGGRSRPLVVPSPVTALGYDPAGRHLIAGGGSNEGGRGAAEYQFGGPEAVAKLFGYDGPVRAVAHGPGWAAAAGGHWRATVWLGPFERAATLRLPHPPEVAAMAHAGRRLVTAGGREVRVWELPPADPPAVPGESLPAADNDGRAVVDGATVRLPGGATLLHTEPVTQVARHPAGRLVATVCLDGAARLWDAVTGRPVGPPLHWHATAVGFAADGRRLLVASPEHPVRGWPVPEPLAGDPAAVRAWATRAVGD